MPYYLKLIDSFPTLIDLARADEKEVLRLWQGLGYYSRARNLHATAKYISESLNGIFPTTYSEILKLKGVGPYTAAAISSICFDEPRPVVDGNVFRFASRYFGIKEDITKAKTRTSFEKILSKHIAKKSPGTFNQAIMEYGATICSPFPSCKRCGFQEQCVAYRQGTQKSLPVKSKKINVRNRFFHYMVISDGYFFLMKERDEKDIWAGLFDFPLIEGDFESEYILNRMEDVSQDFLIEEVSDPFQHLLSHQKIKAVFYRIKLPPTHLKKIKGSLGSKPYSVEEIVNLPKPKLIVNYFQKIGIKF